MNEKLNETHKNHIIIVEDDNDINLLLFTYFIQDGYQATQAYSGTEALLLLDHHIDLVVVDLMLPGLSGEALIEKIRESSNVPILVLSGKAAVGDRVNALGLGADDFLVKPFAKQEVLARVAALLRRAKVYQSQETAAEQTQWRLKDLLLDTACMQVQWQDKAIHLTQTEFLILHEMMKKPGQVFSRDSLYRAVWNEDFIGDDNAITVHISHLRQKLREASGEELIATVWGIGYKMS